MAAAVISGAAAAVATSSLKSSSPPQQSRHGGQTLQLQAPEWMANAVFPRGLQGRRWTRVACSRRSCWSGSWRRRQPLDIPLEQKGKQVPHASDHQRLRNKLALARELGDGLAATTQCCQRNISPIHPAVAVEFPRMVGQSRDGQGIGASGHRLPMITTLESIMVHTLGGRSRLESTMVPALGGGIRLEFMMVPSPGRGIQPKAVGYPQDHCPQLQLVSTRTMSLVAGESLDLVSGLAVWTCPLHGHEEEEEGASSSREAFLEPALCRIGYSWREPTVCSFSLSVLNGRLHLSARGENASCAVQVVGNGMGCVRWNRRSLGHPHVTPTFLACGREGREDSGAIVTRSIKGSKPTLATVTDTSSTRHPDGSKPDSLEIGSGPMKANTLHKEDAPSDQAVDREKKEVIPPSPHPVVARGQGCIIRDATKEDLLAVAEVQASSFHTPYQFQPLDRFFYMLFKAEVYDGLIQRAKAEDLCRSSGPHRRRRTVLVAVCSVTELPEEGVMMEEVGEGGDFSQATTSSSSSAAADGYGGCSAEGTADQGGEIIGAVNLTISKDYDVLRHLDGGVDEYLYISGMAVLEKYRQKKIGILLLMAAEERAKEWGFDRLYLNVYDDNLPARRLYEKVGYRLVARDGFWQSNLLGMRRRILMTKDLGV